MAADLKRLYCRRGNAYVARKEWQQAVDDYARVVTEETTDDSMLANQALARANASLEREMAGVWTVLEPVLAKSELGATLSILPDSSILASGKNPRQDRYRVVLAVPEDSDLLAVRLEALSHPSLPGHGPGRGPSGTFHQGHLHVTATSADGKATTKIRFQKVWVDDVSHRRPINVTGHWDMRDDPGLGIDRVAIWALTEPVRLTAGMTLTIEMQSNTSLDPLDNLGRFRIAISGNPQAIEKEAIQLSLKRSPGIADPLHSAGDGLSTPRRPAGHRPTGRATSEAGGPDRRPVHPGEERRQGLAACDCPVQQGDHGADDRRRTALEAGSRP